MQLFLVAVINDEISKPGSFKESINHLKSYCREEKIEFNQIAENLKLLFRLCEDYKHSGESLIYNCLRTQAKRCLVEDKNLQNIHIKKIYTAQKDKNYNSSSGSIQTLVGANILDF